MFIYCLSLFLSLSLLFYRNILSTQLIPRNAHCSTQMIYFSWFSLIWNQPHLYPKYLISKIPHLYPIYTLCIPHIYPAVTPHVTLGRLLHLNPSTRNIYHLQYPINTRLIDSLDFVVQCTLSWRLLLLLLLLQLGILRDALRKQHKNNKKARRKQNMINSHDRFNFESDRKLVLLFLALFSL